jgi:peptide/nickel transport system substrate-binding protein
MPIWLNQIKSFWANVLNGFKHLPKVTRGDLIASFRNITKREKIIFYSIVLVFILSGLLLVFQGQLFSSDDPNYGGQYREGLIGQPRFINPILATASPIDMDLSRIIYGQLLKFDSDGKIIPDLAEKLPEISADLKTYTITLRKNLQWQDGKPITAEDVLFTIERIQKEEFESPISNNWSRVKLEKIDDFTISFKLREPSNSFIYNLAMGILPKHIWQDLNAQQFRLSDYNLNPIGSGPFVVDGITKTKEGIVKSVTLKPNKKYYDGSVYLSKVVFKFYPDYDALLRAYQSHDIDSLGFVPFNKKAFLDVSTSYSQYRMHLPQYSAVFFNMKSSVLSDKAVRQALWLATERQPVIDQVYFGLADPSYGPLMPEQAGYNAGVEQSTHFSLDEAKAILNKSGWIYDDGLKVLVKNKKPLEFNIVTTDAAINLKTAQIIQSQWEKIGAKINLTIVSYSDLNTQHIRSRNYDALLYSENIADNDPFIYWHSSQIKDPGLNLSNFSNAESDKLLTAARQTSNAEERIKNYSQFQNIITSELPAIFLNRSLYIYNVPSKFKNVEQNNLTFPSERFANIKNWYVGK